MKFAAIDIGSNAVRLLIKNVFVRHDGPIFIKDSLYRVPVRLGEQAFTVGEFSPEKIEDLVNTMKAYRLLIDVHKTVSYRACATSAMRDAANGPEVVERVSKEAGIDIDIISGKEEAQMILHSEFGLHDDDNSRHYLYIDVGGGSTELVYFQKGKVLASRSFKIGTLRLLNSQVSKDLWQEMTDWLVENRPPRRVVTGIGSGGNINKMIKLYGKDRQIHLDRTTVEAAYEHLSGLTFGERVKELRLKPDRADVIEPASKIFRHIMRNADVKTLIVPKFGLSDGIIRELYLANGKQNARVKG